MTGEPPPDTRRHDVFQKAWYRIGLLIFAAYLAVFWYILGPYNPPYAVSVALGTFALGPAIAAPLVRRLPPGWFRVPAREIVLHRLVSVGLFARLLDLSRWNRKVAEPMRNFTGNRAGLLDLEEGVRANLAAHGACFAIHVVLAVLALFGRNPWGGAFWMLFPALFVHLYPMLLQRSILLRLQPLLENPRFLRDRTSLAGKQLPTP